MGRLFPMPGKSGACSRHCFVDAGTPCFRDPPDSLAVVRGNQIESRAEGGDLGGSMRLGAYEAILQPGSKVAEMYGSTDISERHRHRFEVNINYCDRMENAGLKLVGRSPDGVLPEIVEREDHPWFVGVQFHPELKSRPFAPHPLFAGFIAAAKEQSRLV